jgi:acetyltransferase-like isoleucine patch superfamily enzyme
MKVKPRFLPQIRKRIALPKPIKNVLLGLFWAGYDFRDYLIEVVGWIPSHLFRLLTYRFIFGVKIGKNTSIHRNCRFYRPSKIAIGDHSVINRDILLDGRMGITIGNNVSISEGTIILTLEHDINSATFDAVGQAVRIEDYVFIGTRACILPGINLGRGAVVAAGSIVTHDVPPFTIVAGSPAKKIGMRAENLTYSLNYRKFMG